MAADAELNDAAEDVRSREEGVIELPNENGADSESERGLAVAAIVDVSVALDVDAVGAAKTSAPALTDK